MSSPLSPSDKPVTRAPAGSRPARVLVVDDDPLSRSFQTHLLSLLGHEARSEGNPEAALALALGGEFDVLLLDLGMPGLDGFEVLTRLRAQEASDGRRPLAVVAVTGYASETDRQRCLSTGFDEHLAKPIQAATLSAALERLLGAVAGKEAGGADATDVARLRATVRRMKETRTDDRSFTPTATESFALHSAQLLETLRRGLQQRDASAVKRASLTLKASAEFLGALRLATMCEALAAHAGAGEWLQAEVTLGSMNNEHQVVLTLLFETGGP